MGEQVKERLLALVIVYKEHSEQHKIIINTTFQLI